MTVGKHPLSEKEQPVVISDALYAEYLQLLLAGDWKRCRAVVLDLLDRGIDLRLLYDDLFKRSLYEVGSMWEKRQVSVATEHLATSITDSLLSLVHPHLFEAQHIGKSAVISCCANEFHQIGAKMVADLFELHGWDSYFLGANTPTDSLVKLIEEKNPDIVGLSLSIPRNMETLVQMLGVVREEFPFIRTIVGGHAFAFTGPEPIAHFKGVEYLPSLESLEQVIDAGK